MREERLDGEEPRMTYPMHEIDLETPEGDAAEQATTVPGWQDEDVDDRPVVSEENRVVEFDDDYR
jgi:hypothetical protein